MKIQAITRAIVLTVSLCVLPAHAAVTQVIASGTVPYAEQFGGPATMTMRRLVIAPGEVLGWHYHPGVGAYTIVKRGTLVVEDGCGGEEVFTAGQAFIEHVDRVHRGKNLGSEEVETLQTFFVPAGTPISISTPQMCGSPQTSDECMREAWRDFTFPRTFDSQGDCMSFVITGK